MRNIRFKGIIPAIVSPLDDDGQVKEIVLRDMIDWHLDKGCSGFYICGATGEGVVMRPEARKSMAEISVDAVKDRGFVIAHIGAIDLRTATDLARHAKDAGVHGLSSIPPFFYEYKEHEILQYYQAIYEASGLPILMYASPLTGTEIRVETIEKLLDLQYVIGIKWTNYNYYTMRRIKALNGGDVNVLNGPDETLICGLTMGADGGIGGTYNIMSSLYVRIYESFHRGDLAEAQALQYQAIRIIEVLLEYGVLASVKELLTEMGFDVGYCTYPLKRFDEQERKAFLQKIQALSFSLEK